MMSHHYSSDPLQASQLFRIDKIESPDAVCDSLIMKKPTKQSA